MLQILDILTRDTNLEIEYGDGIIQADYIEITKNPNDSDELLF